MTRRFFERLEQGVLCGNIERLSIINDSDPARPARWPHSEPFNQVAHLLDQNFRTFRITADIDEIRMDASRNLYARCATVASLCSRRRPRRTRSVSNRT